MPFGFRPTPGSRPKRWAPQSVFPVRINPSAAPASRSSAAWPTWTAFPPPIRRRRAAIRLMLDALRRIRKAVGDEVFLVACFDQYPFSLACELLGIERAMLCLCDDRPLIEAVMERALDYAAAYARALADAGADMLSGGDSPAGLLGPRFYREAALPLEKRLIARLKADVRACPSLCTFAATRPRSWPRWPLPAPTCWSWTAASPSPRRPDASAPAWPFGATWIRSPSWPAEPPTRCARRPASCWRPWTSAAIVVSCSVPDARWPWRLRVRT